MTTKDYIIRKAVELLLENFSCYEASSVFGVDYRNLSSYVSFRKPMPLKLAFEVLDYCIAKVVIFRGL